MSEHMFGVHYGELSEAECRRRERAAEKHQATFIYADLPDGPRSWFTCKNLGEPWNSRTAREVMDELNRKDI